MIDWKTPLGDVSDRGVALYDMCHIERSTWDREKHEDGLGRFIFTSIFNAV